MRNTAHVARRLTAGQLAAVRYARARRGDLGLSQTELAKKAHISRRTVVEFEAGRSWPNPDTLARIERMGLNLVVGRLTEYAHHHREQDLSTLDADIAAILESNLHPDLKLRLVDRLRTITIDSLHDEAEKQARLLAELSVPGEDEKGRGIA